MQRSKHVSKGGYTSGITSGEGYSLPGGGFVNGGSISWGAPAATRTEVLRILVVSACLALGITNNTERAYFENAVLADELLKKGSVSAYHMYERVIEVAYEARKMFEGVEEWVAHSSTLT